MTSNTFYPGPSVPLSQEIDATKYRQEGETFDDKIKRIALTLSDSEEHKMEMEDILGNMRFLPAGRVQSAIGSRRITTAYNCFVSGTIEDSMESIMARAAEAAETMRRGGGIGYDFSTIRPKNDNIVSLQSSASGPVSFMRIFDAVCQTISSSGHRRGAQMGVLRVDHPDIKEFIQAKRDNTSLTAFNISVGITDKFMHALQNSGSFDLVFDSKVYATLAHSEVEELWDMIMLSTWDWAEPGVLFIDRITEMNNLYYCEEIAATNPCGEQPLPPYGACLLGSFNLTAYVDEVDHEVGPSSPTFNWSRFKKDIPHVVRAMDNVVDRTIYPLKKQEDEAQSKRRMGLGFSGLANAGEMIGYSYGSPEFLAWAEGVFKILRNETYRASTDLAEEKGAFPLYDNRWLQSGFAKTLPYKLRKRIKQHGIRNSHLTSIAPTGTISLVADNISGGIEPPFSHSYERTIQTPTGPRFERVEDYAAARGFKGKTADELSVWEHLSVLSLAQHYVDSACSKTCNVGSDVSYDEFKEIYAEAWADGCKGITTFRVAGKRFGIFNEIDETVEEEKKTEGSTETVPETKGTETDEPLACFFDPSTGQRSCE